MSVDRSLRLKSSLARHRNVLTRAERVERMQAADQWSDEVGALGLPKIGNRKAAAKKKAPKAEAAATPGAAAAPAPAAAAAPAAGGAKKK